MKDQPKIPAEKIPEIFDRAARLYAEKNQNYSVEEIIQAGLEARIPSEYIQRAIAQVQAEQTSKPLRKFQFSNFPLNAIAIAAAFILGGLLTASVAGIQPTQTSRGTTSTNFLETNLERANLKRIDLRGRDLSNINLTKARLDRADLSNTNLSHANLSRARLRNANLSGANLSHANLSRADLRNANLSGAILDGTDLSRARLEGAILPDGMRYQ
ncbi:pentapeptide repeat-containing protein [Chroococcidiopsis sp. TS-821]|uniref:pentapeptide repeat-containing protein n=1 Tax=Chroococcidiopsis sp. TS-821 TaxID=1378066 RepID=UPI000CEED394|nr:pentapeptide repeat-containing protein [Chroococcidiopsis sp. TS-821]PPS44341.1 hypothetical protein B1A85_10330 [Chroococcidiopsis sp. TS-821]